MSEEFKENNDLFEKQPVYGPPVTENRTVSAEAENREASAKAEDAVMQGQPYVSNPGCSGNGMQGQPYVANPSYSGNGMQGQPYAANPSYSGNGMQGQPYVANPSYGGNGMQGQPYVANPGCSGNGMQGQSYAAVPPYGNPQGYPPQGAQPGVFSNQQYYGKPDDYGKPHKNGFGVASMVLGIVSVFLFITCFNYILAIVAIVLGIVQIVNYKPKGMAITGIITAVLSIILNVTVLIMIAFSSDEVSGGVGSEHADPYEYNEGYSDGGYGDRDYDSGGYDDRWFEEELWDLFRDYDSSEQWESEGGVFEL